MEETILYRGYRKSKLSCADTRRKLKRVNPKRTRQETGVVMRQTEIVNKAEQSMDDSSGNTIHNFFHLFGLEFGRVKKRNKL